MKDSKFFDKKYCYAVVGASINTKKYGNIVFKKMLKAGIKAIPINPKGGQILGKKVFSSIIEYKDSIDVVVMVIPPQITLEVLKEVKDKGISKIWFQPGSESDLALEYCRKNKIDFVANSCFMVATDKNVKYYI